LSVAAVLLSYRVTSLGPFRHHFLEYLRTISLPVILGFLIGGLIDHFVPNEYVSKVLAVRKKRTLVKAALLGFLMSACSHGILALSIQLYRKGASIASVITFLLATPWANLPLTFLLFKFFGLSQALYIIVSAIIIALMVGFTYQILERRGAIPHNPNSLQIENGFTIRGDIARRWKAFKWPELLSLKTVKSVLWSSWTLAEMTLWWMLLGILLASIAGAYIPHEYFHKFLGPNVLGLLGTIGFATIIEVCSEGTAPLAFEIYKHTGGIGNAFVFMLAGVVTDYTEIGLVWTNIGRRQAILLPIIAVPIVLVFGYLANLIFLN
jgi:uncharacterized membrane protein YraQ (UPF0718 family)